MLSTFLFIFVVLQVGFMAEARKAGISMIRSPVKNFQLPLLILSVIALISTLTKKDILAFAIVSTIYSMRRFGFAKFIVGVLATVIGGGLIAYFGKFSPLMKLFRIRENMFETGSRGILWQSSLEAIQEYPLFGMGAGAWDLFLPTYNEGLSYGGPHNSLIQIAGEYGIIALTVYIVFLLLLGWYLRLMMKNQPGPLVVAATMAYIGFIVIELFSNPILFGWTNRTYWAWMIIALGFAEHGLRSRMLLVLK
ncbi:hypothetical protein TspCOW1_04740 [Thiohalobacter sp. COW1]|nr:hypothetical protein TspCOW1_04740 [Thiohalobacter sp. COW1]